MMKIQTRWRQNHKEPSGMETPELCEVSDPEAWMVTPHGNVETSESEQMEDDAAI